MTHHARLSASRAERFIRCPGSVTLEETAGIDSGESEFAAEGTVAHAVGEWCLREDADAFMRVGDVIDGIEVTPDMARHVQVYVDYVRQLHAKHGGDLLIEVNLDNPEVHKDFGGTFDAAIVTEDGDIYAVDFKYGAGIVKEAEGSEQLMYYGYGLMFALDVIPDALHLTIVQPRAYHADGPIREWPTTGDAILEWAETTLIPAMNRVDNDPDAYEAGEHCRFCTAKLSCPLMNAAADDAVEEKETQSVTDDELARRYEQTTILRMYIKAVEDECYRRAMAGNTVPGTKLIYGRSSREWKEGAEETIIAKLGEDAYTTPQLKSVAQVEKLPGGKELVAEFAFKKEGNPILVNADKQGREWKPEDGGADFASIDTPAE